MACAGGGGGSWLRDTHAHWQEPRASLSPSPRRPPPPGGHLCRTHNRLLRGGTCSRRVSIAQPIAHLRANDVGKQQVHGHARAGLHSLRCKRTPAPAPGPSGGAVPQLSIPGSLVSSSNFGEFPPNHSRHTYQRRSGSPAAGTYHVPCSSADTVLAPGKPTGGLDGWVQGALWGCQALFGLIYPRLYKEGRERGACSDSNTIY